MRTAALAGGLSRLSWVISVACVVRLVFNFIVMRASVCRSVCVGAVCVYGLMIGWPLASKMRTTEDGRGKVGVRRDRAPERQGGKRDSGEGVIEGECCQILVILDYG